SNTTASYSPGYFALLPFIFIVSLSKPSKENVIVSPVYSKVLFLTLGSFFKRLVLNFYPFLSFYGG
ncbi:MAG: hypothetical protein IKL72_03825, partial [Firmicutes bacterium]|nr:hypothetical protein [Bacillota bacterium]